VQFCKLRHSAYRVKQLQFDLQFDNTCFRRGNVNTIVSVISNNVVSQSPTQTR